MKHFLFLIVTAMLSISLSHSATNTKQLTSLAIEAHKLAVKSFKNNNIDSCILVLNKFIKTYDAQPKQVRDSVKYLKFNRLTVLTQAYCIKGEKKKAIKIFKEAIKYGEIDLESLKNSTYDIIRDNNDFIGYYTSIKDKYDYLKILKASTPYHNEPPLPTFEYAEMTDSNLVKIRTHFNLDSVAGEGDETSKIINLLGYVHNLVRHDGNNPNPKAENSIAQIAICQKENRGLNCRGLALVLNEFYLSMGFKSRVVTCMPKVYISDCHAINVVWSETLNKWVWVDPTNDAYVMDENGVMLGIGEVRQRLIDNRPLVLNDYANWNHQSKVNIENYLYSYMAKNLYYVNCIVNSCYNSERRKEKEYVALIPVGFEPTESLEYKTSNEEYFWQSPK